MVNSECALHECFYAQVLNKKLKINYVTLQMQSNRLIDFREEDEKTCRVNRRNIIKLIATELAAQLAVATKCLCDYFPQARKCWKFNNDWR